MNRSARETIVSLSWIDIKSIDNHFPFVPDVIHWGDRQYRNPFLESLEVLSRKDVVISGPDVKCENSPQFFIQ